MIFPLNRSILNAAASSLSSVNEYVKAGLVSTSLAVTAVKTVPTSVPVIKKKKLVGLHNRTKENVNVNDGFTESKEKRDRI